MTECNYLTEIEKIKTASKAVVKRFKYKDRIILYFESGKLSNITYYFDRKVEEIDCRDLREAVLSRIEKIAVKN